MNLAGVLNNLTEYPVLDIDTYLVREAQRHAAVRASADAAEAARAFSEKRVPVFAGR